MTVTILANANVLDVDRGTLLGERHVVIENDRIRGISEEPVALSSAQIIDLAGLTLMPGLIDAHVHTNAYSPDFADHASQSPFYVAARAIELLGGMLGRGFTTVRDVGGGEVGMARAIAEGRVAGPRLIYGGKALSPTGGHGDMRLCCQNLYDDAYSIPSLGRICDGVSAVRTATREEIRRGAHHIKIMAGGGIASPTDRIDSDQFSEEEIRAIVDEAAMANLYVAAHAYTARSIDRCVRNGVRSIEHGNLLDQTTAALMKERGAFLVPTLITFHALAEQGEEAGLAAELIGKVETVLDAGIQALEIAYRTGIPIAFGTDLTTSHERQLQEFSIRAEVIALADVIRSATTTAAQLVGMESEIGRIAPGYLADLIAFRGNPLDDVNVLTDLQQRLRLIMRGGRTHMWRSGE